MNTFGNIKTNIEKTASELAKKPEFKRFIFEFNALVLKNKDISELYNIYDDLSTKKGVSPDIVNDYVNESIEYSQILMESQTKNIGYLNTWISSWTKSNQNKYSDIDNAIYNNSIRNLESVLESKNNIKKTLISEEKINVKESIHLTESDKEELKTITSLNKDELKKEINTLKESVNSKLKVTLNESKDSDLSNAIQNTINKVNDTKYDHYNLYKLRKLNLGL